VQSFKTAKRNSQFPQGLIAHICLTERYNSDSLRNVGKECAVVAFENKLLLIDIIKGDKLT
jgi:hypothetical protein